MARETKIGLLVGLAFIILFGIILSEKGTGRSDQLTTPPIAAYKPVVELIPPTAPPSAQLTKPAGKEEVADRLTMTEPGGLKLTEQTSPTGTPNTTAKPADLSPVEKIQLAPADIAPKLKPLLPPSPTRSLTQQIPAANPTVKDTTVIASAQDVKSTSTDLTVDTLTPDEPKADAELKTHTVLQGETLASICRQYYPGQAYEMLKQVMTYNKISKPEKLMCGQTIKLPALKTQSTDKLAAKDDNAVEGTDTNSVISKLLVPADDSNLASMTNAKPIKVTLIPEDKTSVAKQKKEIVPTKLAKVTKGTSGSGKTYVVQSKDTLAKIAKRVYGSEKAWTKIYELNKKVISDPKNLKSGQKLRIPASELAAAPKVDND